MKVLASLTLLAGYLAFAPRTEAATGRIAVTAPVTFRLSVAGPVDRSTTFWVAYGPLRGKFGIVQLHRTATGAYSTSTRLPLGARGNFYYIAGTGTMKTRLGTVPGNPTRTIRALGPIAVRPGQTLFASYHPPVG